jgi:hypothetical protein
MEQANGAAEMALSLHPPSATATVATHRFPALLLRDSEDPNALWHHPTQQHMRCAMLPPDLGLSSSQWFDRTFFRAETVLFCFRLGKRCPPAIFEPVRDMFVQ